MVTPLQKRIYTAEVTSIGGRDGHSKSADGAIDFKMGKPAEMGGKGEGYNPEQLFAAAYSACFLGAMRYVADKEKITIPEDTSVNAAVSFGPVDRDVFSLAVDIKVTLPGMGRHEAQALVDKAHQGCAYSNATRGNIEVTVTVA